MNTIRVLLADDHEVVLDSLAMMLASYSGVEVVGKATNGRDALAQLAFTETDIVLSDMHMPEWTGLELCIRLRAQYPEVKLVLLTMEEDPETVRRALQAGVWGYVLKKASRQEVEKAIKTVAGGHRYYAREVSEQLTQITGEVPTLTEEQTEKIKLLGKREIEVIRLIASELPNPEIAKTLFISLSTVETHRRNIFKKLKIHSAVALTRFAVECGIV